LVEKSQIQARAAPLRVDGIETTLVEDATQQCFDALTQDPLPPTTDRAWQRSPPLLFARPFPSYEDPLLVIQQANAVREARPRRP
jgi:hypothetical protein